MQTHGARCENAFTFMRNEHWAFALHLHVWKTGDGGRVQANIPNKFSGKQTMPHPVHGNTLKISAAETKLEDARGENTIDAKYSTQIWIRVRFRFGWDRTEWLRAFDMFSLQMHDTMRVKEIRSWGGLCSRKSSLLPVLNPQVRDGNGGEMLLHEKNYLKINSFRRHMERRRNRKIARK